MSIVFFPINNYSLLPTKHTSPSLWIPSPLIFLKNNSTYSIHFYYKKKTISIQFIIGGFSENKALKSKVKGILLLSTTYSILEPKHPYKATIFALLKRGSD